MQSDREGETHRAEDRRGLLRQIPSVGRLLEAPAWKALEMELGHALVVALLREELERLRRAVAEGRLSAERFAEISRPEALTERVSDLARRVARGGPRPVINATGVVAHTNLGRSVLSEEAARRVAESATVYVDLEYDLARGGRGSRHGHLDPLFAVLFPGYAALVVNNNASAILLALRALARRREVLVSRGELVEIGGGFRVPEILAASGAKLREVGTTNRTRLEDYESALTARTGAILKVHTSNFRIVGFAEETSVGDLAGLARKAGVPLVVDWGSGDLVDLAPLGIEDEIPVARILSEGADLVTFSGDKLLGGPQAGVAVGRPDLVSRLRKDPLARAVRMDRLRIAALREVLWAYARGRATEEIPTLRMLVLAPEEIGVRAERVRRYVAARTGLSERIRIVEGVSRTGGGSSPLGEIPTRLIEIEGAEGDAGPLERALRSGEPPVVGRLHEGRLLLDLRTVLPFQDTLLAERLAEVLIKH
jgi:L-seryl-tRNA(Ser) seleniumtransferase